MSAEEIGSSPVTFEDEIEEEEEVPGIPGWMVTFGDAVSLLLTFFVLLLSFSSFGPTDPARNVVVFNSVIGTGAYPKYSRIKKVEIDFDDTELNRLLSQRETEGGFDLQEKHIEAELLLNNKKNIELNAEKLKRLFDEEKGENKEKGGNFEMQFSKNKMGFVITFEQGIFFNEGKASLKPSSYPILKKIGSLLAEMPNDITVTGYAPDITHTESGSLQDARFSLSIMRANEVAHYLTVAAHIHPERMATTASTALQAREALDNSTLAGSPRASISIMGSFDGYMTLLQKTSLQEQRTEGNGHATP